jgi:hypothetical protein
MIAQKLKHFNAWGTVSVDGNTITVVLSAVSESDRPLNRTLKANNTRPIGSNGTALIAVQIEPKDYILQAREIGENEIANHPKVKKVITNAVDWIRKST